MQNDNLREKSAALVKKLKEVHASPEYMGVWYLSQLHVGAYRGPTYTEELKALEETLKEPVVDYSHEDGGLFNINC